MLASPFGLHEQVREDWMVTVHRERCDHCLGTTCELYRVVNVAEVGECDLAYLDGLIGRCEDLSERLDVAISSPEGCARLFKYYFVEIRLDARWLECTRPQPAGSYVLDVAPVT